MTKTIVKAHDLSFEELISPESIQKQIVKVGEELTAKFKNEQPIMLGILNGSFIFAADLIRSCHFDCHMSFVKLASYKGTQSSGTISQLIGLEYDIKDKHIIIVEDIIDSGKTINYFLNFLKSQEVASITMVTLLFKPEALQFEFPIDHVCFEIDNKFVIGYGLDYNGLGRNLPGIYQLTDTE